MLGETKYLTPLLGELLHSSRAFLADVGYQHRPVVRVSMDALPPPSGGCEGAFDAILASMSPLFFDRVEFAMFASWLECARQDFRLVVVGTVFQGVMRVHVGMAYNDGHVRKYLDAKQLVESTSTGMELYDAVLSAVGGLSWREHLYDEHSGTPPKIFSGDKVGARIHRDAVLAHSDALTALVQEGLRSLQPHLPPQICMALSSRKSWQAEESVSHGEE